VVCAENPLSGLIYAESRIRGISRIIRLSPATRRESAGCAPPPEFDPCLETVKVMKRLMAEFFDVGKSAAGGSETGKRSIS
jgi:hypothetical protein